MTISKALLRILLALAAGSSFCVSADNVFFGGEDARYNKTYGSLEPDSQELGGSISVSIIVKNMQIESNGVVHMFSARVGSIRGGNSTVHMQIWRPVGNDNYQLIRTKKIENLKVGINEVPLKWYITAGDYIGMSCNGYCPIYKDPSNMAYMSWVRMGGNIREEYVTDNIYQFDNPTLFAHIAVQVEVEINRPAPPTTPVPVVDPTSMTTGDDSNNGGEGESTTPEEENSRESQVDLLGEDNYILWWLIGAGVLILIIIVVVLVCVIICYWRKDRSHYEELLGRSRPPSVISGQKGLTIDSARSGRPLSSASSTFNTLQRQSGLQVIEESEIPDIRVQPAHQQPVLSVSPSAHRSARLVEDNGEPTIVFDNGQTYHLGEAIVTPHPPPEVLPLPPTSPAPTD